MYSALINAVLRSYPNYDILFESLCWPEDSWPQVDQVEALTALIEGLGPFLTDPDSATPPLTVASRCCIRDKVESVIWSKCLPLLYRISAEARDDAQCRESTATVCRLLGVCVAMCDGNVWRKVVSSILPSLQRISEEELLASGTLSVPVVTEVLAALMPLLTADEKLTFDTLNYALSSIRSLPNDLLSKVMVRIILTLLNCCSDAKSNIVLKRILDYVCSWHSTERTSVVTQRTLLCFTVLSDHLLKSLSPTLYGSREADPRLCPQFWIIVQDGLTHRDNVSRKRALYLLKRCAALSEEEGFDSHSSPSKDGNITETQCFANIYIYHMTMMVKC